MSFNRMLLTALGGLMLATPAFSQISDVQYLARDTTAGRVGAIAYWRTGDYKRDVFQQKKNTYRDTTLLSEKSVYNHVAELTVVDSTDTAYNLVWRIEDNPDDTASADRPSGIDWGEVLEGIDEHEFLLRYRTDELGALDTLLNQPALEGILQRVTDEMRARMTDTLGHLPPEKQQVLQNAFNLVLTPQYLFNHLFTEPVEMFHYFHGFALGLNDTLSYRDQLVNLFGGPPIDTWNVVYVAAVDTTTNECMFVLEKRVDAETLTPIVGDARARLRGTVPATTPAVPRKASRKTKKLKLAESPEDPLTDWTYDLWQKLTCLVDVSTGWPTFISQIREITGRNEKTGESYTEQDLWTFEPVAEN